MSEVIFDASTIFRKQSAMDLVTFPPVATRGCTRFLMGFSKKTCSKASIYFFTLIFCRGHLKNTCILDLGCTVWVTPNKSEMEKYTSEVIFDASTIFRKQSAMDLITFPPVATRGCTRFLMGFSAKTCSKASIYFFILSFFVGAT